jgi:hypothetical protein
VPLQDTFGDCAPLHSAPAATPYYSLEVNGRGDLVEVGDAITRLFEFSAMVAHKHIATATKPYASLGVPLQIPRIIEFNCTRHSSLRHAHRAYAETANTMSKHTNKPTITRSHCMTDRSNTCAPIATAATASWLPTRSTGAMRQQRRPPAPCRSAVAWFPTFSLRLRSTRAKKAFRFSGVLLLLPTLNPTHT